ncbi:hypothetical protein K431DRAFT_25416 [Polychaeton citri CBS 116435]|uniref:Uncharacterized protein n=1 Tax=Polychaeton citri CBS 116435 TaxID=1314669 RepID=A0A9P4UKF1_9PEZI|nr:hypothetical protein K431DRAFT_25416 [Polychaeton citri CBS 116435]
MLKTGRPVRSGLLKQHRGRLVVSWVTRCESRLSNVFAVLRKCFLRLIFWPICHEGRSYKRDDTFTVQY